MKPIYLLLSFALIFLACDRVVEVDTSAVAPDRIQAGVELMGTHCLTCHRVGDFEIDEVLAPPLWGIRAHYLEAFSEPQAFVDAMAAFILEPKMDTSLLPIEVTKYGLKAPVSLSENEIRSVVWAIYAGRLERPGWSREYRKRHADCAAQW